MERTDFGEKYRLDPVSRSGGGILEEMKKSISTELSALKKISPRPKAMKYFEELVSTDRRIKELKSQPEPVIGVFCHFVPDELILASGATSVRLCSGYFPPVDISEEILPRDICPVVKSSFGLKICHLGYPELCQIIIVPASCDAKKKLGHILNSYVPTWVVSLPSRRDIHRDLAVWQSEIATLKRRIEEFTGNRITRNRLEQAIKLFHRRTETFRAIYELRRRSPYVLSGRDMLLLIHAAFFDDISRWIHNAELLLKELEEMAKASRTAFREDSPRILVTGAPTIWPNWKVLDIIEEAGAVIVADTFCSGTQYLFDPVEVDEWTFKGEMTAIALRYLTASVCPCFVGNEERIDQILDMVDSFNIDGVIYHDLRLCQLFDMETVAVKSVLREKQIPFLNIQTDYSYEDREQIRVRVEAFLEMIRGKK